MVVGHWSNDEVQCEISVWARAACAWAGWQGARLARFGDNMRDVAEMAGVEFLLIDENTRVDEFKDTLRWNDLYYHLNQGL